MADPAPTGGALHLAAERADLAALQELVDIGADVNAADAVRRLPRARAAQGHKGADNGPIALNRRRFLGATHAHNAKRKLYTGAPFASVALPARGAGGELYLLSSPGAVPAAARRGGPHSAPPI